MNKEIQSTKRKQGIRHFIFQVFILMIAALIVVHYGKVYGFIKTGIGIISPFVIGLGIAYIWNLILEPIERLLFSKNTHPKVQKIRRPVSVVLSLLIILGILALVLYLVIPQLYESFKIIGRAIPEAADGLKTWFLQITQDVSWTEDLRTSVEKLNINWGQLTSRFVEFLRGGLGGFVGSSIKIVSNVVGFFVGAFTALLFAVYILFEKETVGNQLDRVGRAYMKESHRDRIRYVLGVLDEAYSNFFKGQVLDAFIVGALLLIVMLIFRMPYAVTISVVVMVSALIPMVGAFIGGGLGFLMIAVLSIQQALVFLIVLIFVQQLEGDLIYPKIVGDSIGLPGIWVFSAVIIGGAVAGPLGMLLGVPLVAALYKILRQDVNSKVNRKAVDHPRTEAE